MFGVCSTLKGHMMVLVVSSADRFLGEQTADA